MSLAVSHLARRFGATQVLRGIDLTVAEGELVALLGPSGSGKTTLLRIIAGLDWPDAGALSFDGTDWLAKSAAERRIGQFQNADDGRYGFLQARGVGRLVYAGVGKLHGVGQMP